MAKLIFVYNANSGKMNAALDIAHKIISPGTYQCQLCQLTHSTLSERDEWKAFRQQSEHEFIFLHKDEFEQTYSEQFDYPVILQQANESELIIFLDATAIAQHSNSRSFINIITEKLSHL